MKIAGICSVFLLSWGSIASLAACSVDISQTDPDHVVQINEAKSGVQGSDEATDGELGREKENVQPGVSILLLDQEGKEYALLDDEKTHFFGGSFSESEPVTIQDYGKVNPIHVVNLEKGIYSFMVGLRREIDNVVLWSALLENVDYSGEGKLSLRVTLQEAEQPTENLGDNSEALSTGAMAEAIAEAVTAQDPPVDSSGPIRNGDVVKTQVCGQQTGWVYSAFPDQEPVEFNDTCERDERVEAGYLTLNMLLTKINWDAMDDEDFCIQQTRDLTHPLTKETAHARNGCEAAELMEFGFE